MQLAGELKNKQTQPAGAEYKTNRSSDALLTSSSDNSPVETMPLYRKKLILPLFSYKNNHPQTFSQLFLLKFSETEFLSGVGRYNWGIPFSRVCDSGNDFCLC